MPGNLAVVTVTIADISRLTQLIGSGAASRGLADFGEGLDDLLSRLLAGHEVIGRYRLDRQGRWSACFRMHSGDQPQAMRLACIAIEDEGRRLMEDLVASVFGDAAGSRIAAALFVSVMPSDTDLEDIWSSWVSWAKETRIVLSRDSMSSPLEGLKGALSRLRLQMGGKGC